MSEDEKEAWQRVWQNGHPRGIALSPESPPPGAPERQHELKTWPEYYAAVADGSKPFELREDDRGFAVSDVLWLREYDPLTGTYSGRECRRRISYILRSSERGPSSALPEGYTILGLSADESDLAHLRTRVQELEQERDEAMRVLAPNMPESGLVDACRQVKQVAISEADNADAAEAALLRAQREIEQLREVCSAICCRTCLDEHASNPQSVSCYCKCHNSTRDEARWESGFKSNASEVWPDAALAATPAGEPKEEETKD